jgi:putrescine aminotransferase
MSLKFKNKLCTGCHLCELVCSAHHFGEFAPSRARIRVSNHPLEGQSEVMACFSCPDAPCIAVCPQDAVSRLGPRQPLFIDPAKCDGCSGHPVCVPACPYGAMYFDTQTGCALACDLCDGDPQCVKFCYPQAVAFSPPDLAIRRERPTSHEREGGSPMHPSLQEALTYSQRWTAILNNPTLTEEEAKQIIEESKTNFYEHFNKGWLEYRKSVTEAGDWAATEWTGSGAIFHDILGREYIDCLGGYGLLDLGWSHPEVVNAVRAQLTYRTPMPSQELIDPLRGVLARLVALITPGDIKYSFFAASGTEAIEGAIKLAKMYTRKSGFIVALKAFHGKTMGSLSMLGKADYRQPAGTLYGGPVYHVPFGDADAVERQLDICQKVGIDIAAVLMEPIQGEAGAIVPPDDFWPRLRELTHHYGVLLIADEVQTGMGRTGKLWGVDNWNVVPDILSVAKSFGGGVMPISAFCSTEEIWQVMMEPNPFIHTTTTGGGPLACSAAIAAIHVTLRERLWEQAAAKGAYLIPKLKDLAAQYPQIFDQTFGDNGITGRGLLIGMHFKNTEVGYRTAAGLFKRGVVVAGTLTSAHTVRIEPPLVITGVQMDAVLYRLADTLVEVSKTL